MKEWCVEINNGLNKLLSHQVPISREALMCHVVTTWFGCQKCLNCISLADILDIWWLIIISVASVTHYYSTYVFKILLPPLHKAESFKGELRNWESKFLNVTKISGMDKFSFLDVCAILSVFTRQWWSFLLNLNRKLYHYWVKDTQRCTKNWLVFC